MSTNVSGVRILFDGIPAPIVYVTATQCSAVIPYFGAINPTTHVQVEYQGVRSDPFQIAVTATAPGLFTADSSGKGQASATNSDGVTPNSSASPAHPGSIVTLWATGEGLTDPPGVDGRLAAAVVPKPLAQVTVNRRPARHGAIRRRSPRRHARPVPSQRRNPVRPCNRPIKSRWW